jgi:hypothetical protein
VQEELLEVVRHQVALAGMPAVKLVEVGQLEGHRGIAVLIEEGAAAMTLLEIKSQKQ